MLKGYDIPSFTKLKFPAKRFAKSGIHKMDERSGFTIGGLTLLAGVSGTGKSILALSSAILGCQDNDKKALYFSFENDIQVDYERVNKILDQYHTTAERIKTLEYFNTTDATLDEIEELVKASNGQCDRVFIDSIDFLDGTTGATGMDTYNNYTGTCKRLTKIASDYHVAIILTIQFNKEATTKPLEDVDFFMLNGGKAPAHKASTIWGYLKDGCGNMVLKCLKDRDARWVVGDIISLGPNPKQINLQEATNDRSIITKI